MKSLALFVCFCVLISFVNSSDSQEEVFFEKAEDCKNPCEGCQKIVYDLKFNKRADCSNSKCYDTVIVYLLKFF